ncbi:MAG: DsbA family protein [Candidatus Falkowbacteria bacterium]|nr:DsbA family protein [Candidatus Falkowbacteria bacterium]
MEENKSVFKIMGKWLLVSIAILLLGFIFACLFYIVHLIRTGEWQSQQLSNSTEQENVKALQQMTKNSPWLGAANPQVTIIEFGDFSCTLCQESFSTIREISRKYKDQVKIIFKDFPVISENSASLALAARCANEQGLFWPMYDKLFINQGVTTQEQLSELAKQIGADTSRFTTCFNNKKYLKDIQQDYADGETLKITGTPTWFINGNKVEGAIPHDTFINIIEQFLK